MSQKTRVIVVNDSPEFLTLMAEFLTDEGYDVTTLPKHQGAFEQVKAQKPDIVICDLMFGGVQAGWALVDMLFLDPETRSIPLILCSAATRDIQEAAPSLAAKGVMWLEKPFQLEQLLDVLEQVHTHPASKLRPEAPASKDEASA